MTAADRLQGATLPDPPQWLFFCPQAALLQHAVKRWRGWRVPGFFGETFLLKRTKNRVGVAGHFGVGSPVIGVLVEEFSAWGVKNFVLMGLAGGLQPSLHGGDLVLVEAAVREEGTSHHYLPPAPLAVSSDKISQFLQPVLKATGLPLQQGASWTTDAPYRETASAVTRYRQQGVLTVEMETAALFAVARFCAREAGAVLAVSDSLADGVWQKGPDDRLLLRHLKRAFDAVIQAVVDAP